MTGFRHFAHLGPAVSGIASVALLFLVIGCGGSDEETAQTAPPESAPAVVELEKGTREVQMPGGHVGLMTSGETPKGYPSDLPMPPDSEPKAALFIPGQDGLATFVSQTSRSDLVEYFKRELPSQGWSIDSTDPSDNRVTITATKEGRKAQVMIANGASGREIIVRVEGG